MTENLSEQDMLREISPFGGYAHGDYVAQCQHCRRKFFGDKRAWQCLPCAVQLVLATMKDRGAAAERERAEDAAARERMTVEDRASDISTQIVTDVSELADRTSPDGRPWELTVTADELALIAERAAITALRDHAEQARAEEREKGKYISYADVVRLLREACDREGGQIDFARKHDISPAYVSDVVRERRDPGQGILAALGLVKVTLYARNSGDRNDG